MHRFLLFCLILVTFISCSKNDDGAPTPDIIPDIIDGVITDFMVTPIDINTPDKGKFLIAANNTMYEVDFNAAAQSASNAIIVFETDTILNDQSREFANMGKDVVAYYPVENNLVSVFFDDGRKVTGTIDLSTTFGGVFGEALINQWRDPNDPAKPTQKAKDDIIHFMQRYSDRDGPGPETTPQYLFVQISIH